MRSVLASLRKTESLEAHIPLTVLRCAGFEVEIQLRPSSAGTRVEAWTRDRKQPAKPRTSIRWQERKVHLPLVLSP